MHKMYAIFDGRYRYDEDRSICIQVPGPTDEGVTLEKAIEEAREVHESHGDIVLVESDWDPEERVANGGRIVWDPEEDD